MVNKIIFGLLAVLVVALACAPADTVDTTTGTVPQDNVASGNTVAQTSEPDVTFSLTGQNFEFQMDGERNPTLTVQEGDLVRIEFESTQGFHDWVLDEFNAQTEQMRDTDGATFVEFVADQAGTYEYYCSVGSHRQQGMFGSLVVE